MNLRSDMLTPLQLRISGGPSGLFETWIFYHVPIAPRRQRKSNRVRSEKGLAVNHAGQTEIRMSDTMTREELFGLVGQDLGTSDWFQLGQDRINQFADVTEDRQFIHIDPVRAADSPFGGTIAHGMLTLSMIVHLCDNFAPSVEGVRMVINYGFDRVRFAAPVKVDGRIRAVATLIDVKERSGQMLVKAKVTIEIEGESKPALVAEWLTMHFS